MDPNRVLADTTYAGLVALLRLMEKRANEQTKDFYLSMQKIWSDARRKVEVLKGIRPWDFRPIRKAERNMRKQFLRFLWESTKRYGNTETKRVRSWRKGTVGPLNGLLNYAGARLRDLAVTRYPFSDPDHFQILESLDGSVSVISKTVYQDVKLSELQKQDYLSQRAKARLKGIDKRKWRAGYKHTSRGPLLLLEHPSLPELDFVDMIRAHVVELCRQCFIYALPRNRAQRYIRLLIHRLRPFLDWVYTQGKTGQSHFNPEADRTLRDIVLEIRALYGKRHGRKKRATEETGQESSHYTVEWFKNQISELEMSTTSSEVRAACSMLRHAAGTTLAKRDVEKLFERIDSASKEQGTSWHEILLSGLPHPKSLKSVTYAGDTMLEGASSVLVVGELPLATPKGKGKADVVVFVRRGGTGRGIWAPVMILEVKTKTAFDYNLYGAKARWGEGQYGPQFYTWKRKLSEDEWSVLTESRPNTATIEQLEAYESGLIQGYNQLHSEDKLSSASLWKGVITLDTSQDYLEAFRAFHQLLDDVATSLITQSMHETTATSWIPDPEQSWNGPRIRLLLYPPEQTHVALDGIEPPDCLPSEDPFEYRQSDARVLTVYISVADSTSAGRAGAWVSKNWHLLNHMRECSDNTEKRIRICWLDLVGDFPTPELTRARFGLEYLLEKNLIAKQTYSVLKKMLENILFTDLNKEVESALDGDSNSLTNQLNDAFGTTREDEEIIVVVDGWDELKHTTVGTRMHGLNSIEHLLLNLLPVDNTNVIWVDDGVKHTATSPDYLKECVKPLRYDSPRRFHVDEIIYNMPTCPRVFGWSSPWVPHARVIVQDTPTSVMPWQAIIRVPQLIGWPSKFRGLSKKNPVLTRNEMKKWEFQRTPMHNRGVSLASIYAAPARLSRESIEMIEDTALSLAPSLLRPRSDAEAVCPEGSEDAGTVWTVSPVSSGELVTNTLTDRLQLVPERPPPSPSRSQGYYVEVSKITRQWYYDSFPEPDDEDYAPGSVRRPPIIQTTSAAKIDSLECRSQEVRRLRNATEFLLSRVPTHDNLYLCLKRIREICSIDVSVTRDADSLLEALQEVGRAICRRLVRQRVWDVLAPKRRNLIDILNSANRENLQKATADIADPLLLYGNNLFLAVLAAVKEVTDRTDHALMLRLWPCVAEWTFYQIGFEPDITAEDTADSVYDFHAIYSNLVFRARILADRTDTSSKDADYASTMYGQVIWYESYRGYDGLITIPEEMGFAAGLLEGEGIPRLSRRAYRCTVDRSAIANFAKNHSHPDGRVTFMLTKIEDSSLLWEFVGDHEEKWILVGELNYKSPPPGEIVAIPWFHLGELSQEAVSRFSGYVPPPVLPPTDLDDSVDGLLTELAELVVDEEKIKVTVSLDPLKKMYLVKLGDDTVELDDTFDVIRLLRHPIRTGQTYRTPSGKDVQWDHLTDIEYDEILVKHYDGKTSYSLSFLRPLVHHSRFFPDHYFLPETCADLLAMRYGDSIQLIVGAPEREGHLRFRAEGLPSSSKLKELEGQALGFYKVALLTEIEQLVEPSTSTVHQIEVEVEDASRIRLLDSETFPTLHGELIDASEIEADDIEHDYSAEEHLGDGLTPPNQWKVMVSADKVGIWWEAERGEEPVDRDVLLDDPKLLLEQSFEKAIGATRKYYEIIVVPALGYVENEENVLKEQIPEAVREHRRIHASSPESYWDIIADDT
ncbi:MAG: hypothetical protein GF309_16465 [Candidatus Lokiarchaeota archaeon]|nr:hypothetical protein [Candidatus Lokiarchaeota archaeon]